MVAGEYRVIDAHCHIYPEKIAARATAGTDQFYDFKSACKGTVSELAVVGDSAGIDHYIVQSVATTPKQVGSINEFIASTAAESGGRITGLGTLHPDSGDIEGDFNRLLALGLKGVKLHPDIQRFKIDDYRCLKIYELCEGRIPILMHTGDSRYDYSNPNRLLPVLKIYKGLTVIGAHLGGWSVWDEAARVLPGMPNLYVDCSSCMSYLPADKVRELIRRYGTERVLFGSDYPMWSPAAELEGFLKLGLTKQENQCILYENARKIFQTE